jgi:hypothetical protein
MKSIHVVTSKTFFSEIEHEAWFSEFLGHGPSGHHGREGRPNSPYVGKFLNAGQ